MGFCTEEVHIVTVSYVNDEVQAFSVFYAAHEQMFPHEDVSVGFQHEKFYALQWMNGAIRLSDIPIVTVG
jgi:hypothetical protein